MNVQWNLCIKTTHGKASMFFFAGSFMRTCGRYRQGIALPRWSLAQVLLLNRVEVIEAEVEFTHYEQ